MATITGLTAERMLEIEAASVVDGDVVGNDLILAKKDGSIINAGNVRGPAGPTGPMGSSLAVVTARDLLEVGQANQLRAGRQLTPADFTNMGLSVPLGLWNLSNFNDSSGNARHLTNKGGATTLVPGINGIASTAAIFTGASTAGLYLSDTGGADPFRMKVGTVGCWFRTARRATQQTPMSKFGAAAAPYMWEMYITPQNSIAVAIGTADGTGVAVLAASLTDVCDDRWHFGVFTHDGGYARIYVDGSYESRVMAAYPLPNVAQPLSIGTRGMDSAVVNGANPFYGRMDEAFVTSDVLSDDQIRNLYCASFSHSLGAIPSGVSMSVQRKKRGVALATTDFPSQPARLYNFTGGSLADQGSGGVALGNAGTAPILVSGADGAKDGAFQVGAVALAHFAAVDTGLPAGLAARSFGAWFKGVGASQAIISWGTYSTGFTQLQISAGGVLGGANNTDIMAGPFVADGLWHFAVVVEDNAAADGVKRKLYLDGRCVGNSIVMNPVVLAGAGRFRIGAQPDGTAAYVGSIDAGFVCNYALTIEQIRALYDKSSQALAVSPKAAEDHIEAMESGRLLGIFDTIESSDSISLAVTA